MPKTYKVIANRTPQDVLDSNDVTLETGLTLEEARASSLEYMREQHYIAVWIEEEEPKPEPRITRTIESDRTGVKYVVTRCDGWAI